MSKKQNRGAWQLAVALGLDLSALVKVPQGRGSGWTTRAILEALEKADDGEPVWLDGARHFRDVARKAAVLVGIDPKLLKDAPMNVRGLPAGRLVGDALPVLPFMRRGSHADTREDWPGDSVG